MPDTIPAGLGSNPVNTLNLPGNVEVRPVPDPTVLTTQQMLREVGALRELLETRLSGMDKAIELLHDTNSQFPDKISISIRGVREILEARLLEMDKALELIPEDYQAKIHLLSEDSRRDVGRVDVLSLERHNGAMTATQTVDRLSLERHSTAMHAVEVLKSTVEGQFVTLINDVRREDQHVNNASAERHVSALKALADIRVSLDATIASRVTTVDSVINTMQAGMDKALVSITASIGTIPTLIDTTVRQYQGLHEEKFKSIAIQFTERDVRTEQTSKDSKVAVDAALQAAKEAVGEQNKSNALAISKSENTFTKQIDQIGTLITTLNKSFDDKIDDIKQRLTVMESRKEGEGTARKGIGDMFGYIVAGIMMLIAIGTIVLTHH